MVNDTAGGRHIILIDKKCCTVLIMTQLGIKGFAFNNHNFAPTKDNFAGTCVPESPAFRNSGRGYIRPYIPHIVIIWIKHIQCLPSPVLGENSLFWAQPLGDKHENTAFIKIHPARGGRGFQGVLLKIPHTGDKVSLDQCG